MTVYLYLCICVFVSDCNISSFVPLTLYLYWLFVYLYLCICVFFQTVTSVLLPCWPRQYGALASSVWPHYTRDPNSYKQKQYNRYFYCKKHQYKIWNISLVLVVCRTMFVFNVQVINWHISFLLLLLLLLLLLFLLLHILYLMFKYKTIKICISWFGKSAKILSFKKVTLVSSKLNPLQNDGISLPQCSSPDRAIILNPDVILVTFVPVEHLPCQLQ